MNTLNEFARESVIDYLTEMTRESMSDYFHCDATDWCREVATRDCTYHAEKVGLVYSTVYDDDGNEHDIQLWINLNTMTFAVDIDGNQVATEDATDWFTDNDKYCYGNVWEDYYSLACDMAQMWG